MKRIKHICASVVTTDGFALNHEKKNYFSVKRQAKNDFLKGVESSVAISVRLSLLTMTNPNQRRVVLLFVCSKMADETNLSSKLPVADRKKRDLRKKAL